MKFNQFENDALINFGKKHRYITESMSGKQINEILPAVAAAARAAATGAGKWAKGARQRSAQDLKKSGANLAATKAKRSNAVNKVASVVPTPQTTQQPTQPPTQQPSQANAVPNVVPKTGQTQHNVPAGGIQKKHKGKTHGHKTNPKDTTKIAQRATTLKSVGGGKASGGLVAKGLDKISAGGTIPPNLVKSIAPYTKKLQVIMNDPQLFTKFKMLMKQADSAQQKSHA